MTDHRASRLLTKMEIPLLLAVPAVMTAALLAGIEQAALAMLVVVALVLALFFAGYETSRPGLRQIMPTLVRAALAAAGRVLFGPIPDFKRYRHYRGCDTWPSQWFYGRRVGSADQQFLFWARHVDAVADVCLGSGGLYRWRTGACGRV